MPIALPTAAQPDWVTPDDLNVHPDLLGLPLARPRQRLLAMAVDAAAIALLSSLANVWLLLAVALGVATRALHQQRGPGARGLWVLGALVAGLLALGLQQAVSDHQTTQEEDAAPTAADEASASSAASAPAVLVAQPPASAAAAAGASSVAADQPVPTALADLRHRLQEAADELGWGYGWSLLYFTLLPAWWGGRSPGKALMGLQVRELTGKPMTMRRSLLRYGGYAAGMATGGIGLLQLCWDPNRQAIQDKTAHTVVVDTRRPRRPGPVTVTADQTGASPEVVPEAVPEAAPRAVS